MGRPKLLHHTHSMHLKLGHEQHQAFKAIAKSRGLTMAETLRQMVFREIKLSFHEEFKK